MRRLLIAFVPLLLILLTASVSLAAVPTVVSTNPVNGATGVAVDSTISALFSVTMRHDSIVNERGFRSTRFVVKDSDGNTVPGTIDYRDSTKRAIFTPDNDLAYSTTYTVTISKKVESDAGDEMGTKYEWSFTTAANVGGDTTPPTVTFTDPGSGVSGIPVTAAISATFSEPMNAATISTSTFTVSGGVTGTVTYNASSNTATFTPSANLAGSTSYTVTITTGVKDLAGNAMGATKAWTFTTAAVDTTRPTVTSTDPTGGATGVPVNIALSATFSEAMNDTTVTATTFTLKAGTTSVAGTVSYNPSTFVATFTPSAPLANGTTYTATITTGVRDVAGNALAANYTFTVTTVAAAIPAALNNYCQSPPFISSASSSVMPNVLLVVDNSGSMYEFAYKASGTGSSTRDTSYNSELSYYGYFDSTKMYAYDTTSGGYFKVDATKSPDKTSFWSGNFLNWLTMRRVDVVRKVLVGGKTQPRSANNPNYLIGAENPDRDTLKGYNNIKYTVDNGTIKVDSTGATYNIKVYVGDNPPGDGIILRMSDQIRFGIMFFNEGNRYESGSNSVRDGGYVAVDLGSTGTNLITQVENTDPSTWTPLGETLYEATRYFQAGNSAYNGGTYSGKDPIEYRCQKNFVLVLTDGESTKDKNLPGSAFGSNPVSDASGFNVQTYMDKIATNEGTSSQKSTSANGSDGTYYLEGVSYWAHTTDMRTSTLGKSNIEGKQNLTIYTVFAFDDSAVGRDILKKTAKYGAFEDKNNNDKPDLASEWDKNGDSIPDTYFEAQQGDELERKLMAAFTDILSRVSSGTAASILSNSEGSGASLLQAVFYPMKYFAGGTSTTWVGELQNLWYYLDPFLQNSTIREDSTKDNILELKQDKMVKFYFDTSTNETVVDRYTDLKGDSKTFTLADSSVSPDDVNSLWRAGNLLWSRNISSDPRTIYTIDPAAASPALISFNTADSVNGIHTKSSWWGYLQAANTDEAKKIIDYVNGTDQSGYRARKVLIGSDTTAREWRLGDIVNSTPKIQSSVRLNAYSLLSPNGYGDSSYSQFVSSTDYKGRGMVYVGGNDGMLHAFKLGTLDVSGQTVTKKATLSGSNLGREQWAFIPKNVLPYLKYLGDPNYDHIYFVDSTPLLTDASIYPVSSDETKFPGCDAANYWKCEKKTTLNSSTGALEATDTSWRTILIGGMGLGGASRNSTATCSTASDCVKTPINGLGYSSYFALDVTNPDSPSFMWEFYLNSASPGTLGYSTTGPAIVRVGEKSKNGRWFAVFASGPTGPIDTTNKQFLGKSDQNLKLFIVDLATGALVRTIDTGLANAYAGSLSNSVIDTERWNGGSSGFYQDNAVYIGYVQKDTSTNTWTKGGVLRLLTKESIDPNDADATKQWAVSTVISGVGPVTSSVSKLQDRQKGKLWLYFGTGRYYYKTDDPDSQRALYGIMEPCYTSANTIDGSCTTARTVGELVNQTTSPAATLPADKGGWYINLDTSALNDGFASERVITNPIAATNGAVFFATVRPTTDVCGFGGNSFLWAVKYDTGSQPPAAAMKGQILMQVSTGAFAEISLGTAFTAMNNRKTGNPITGLGSGGFSPVVPPKPTKRILQIQEK